MLLSSKYNFSFGFIPAVIAMLAGTFTTPAYAACIGGGIGLVLCLLHQKQVLPLLLYGTTAMLLLLAIILFLIPHPLPPQELPLLFETVFLLPPILLLVKGNRWLKRLSTANGHRPHYLLQSTEAAIVSARIVFALAAIHGLILLTAWLIHLPTDGKTSFMLYEAAPPGVFITAILLNQAGICYFNKRLRQIAFVPVVNIQGEIIGKKPLLTTILQSDKNTIYPLIRIAITAYGMLYLSSRPENSLYEKEKTDLPLENFPLFGENIEQAARRITKQMFPQASFLQPHFNFKYYDEHSHRLIYLFLLELKDSHWLKHLSATHGKLWPLQQIEIGLGKDYFSRFLEQEFTLLKNIICTREKYKES